MSRAGADWWMDGSIWGNGDSSEPVLLKQGMSKDREQVLAEIQSSEVWMCVAGSLRDLGKSLTEQFFVCICVSGFLLSLFLMGRGEGDVNTLLSSRL